MMIESSALGAAETISTPIPAPRKTSNTVRQWRSGFSNPFFQKVKVAEAVPKVP